MNLSQTQLANYATMFSGIVMFFLTMFNITAEEGQVTFIVFAVFTMLASGYNFYQRFKKGDISLLGARK